MLPGTPARATHDYKRYGTTSLFAALDAAWGNWRSETRLVTAWATASAISS
jgi:hypothetical protein